LTVKKILHIENLDCPVCAEALQTDLSKMKGVNSVSVDYVTQTITLDADDETTLARVVKKVNAFEQVRVLDGGMYAMKCNSRMKEWLFIGISAVLFLAGFLVERLFSGLPWTIVYYILYATAYLLVGHGVLISTCKNLIKGRVFDENFLMTVASIGAIALGEMSESVLVMLLYQLGELLQLIAVGSSRKSVAGLMALKSETATILVSGEQKTVQPEALQVGDLIVVKAGERVPTDCILQSETAVMDTKSLTGEAEARAYKMGAEILSGCINAGGMVELKVFRPYRDSAVAQILDMVENASAGKAKPEKFITKFARVYTPIVCGLALALAIFAPLLEGWMINGNLQFSNFDRWVQSALTFLVISCPCALIISVPLSYFTGIGVCAKNGILVKGATYLDTIAHAKVLAMDKTGTLTEGQFRIVKVHAHADETELLSFLAAVERGSSHPIAKAFIGVESKYFAERVTEVAGCGVSAEINGKQVCIGTAKWLTEQGVFVEEIDSIYTVIHVAQDGKYIGSVEVGDCLRAEAKETLDRMEKLGFIHRIMLTGDRIARAEKLSNEVGMSAFKAELLPTDKLAMAEELKKNGGLIYVGDGINDAPVMATADCAVSMGKLGSAAAIEASDMVLISDNLSALPKAVKIARRTRAVVMQNIIFSIVMKVGFMVLGAVGVLPLWLAVFADVGVMLLAVLNSFRVRFIG